MAWSLLESPARPRPPRTPSIGAPASCPPSGRTRSPLRGCAGARLRGCAAAPRRPPQDNMKHGNGKFVWADGPFAQTASRAHALASRSHVTSACSNLPPHPRFQPEGQTRQAEPAWGGQGTRAERGPEGGHRIDTAPAKAACTMASGSTASATAKACTRTCGRRGRWPSAVLQRSAPDPGVGAAWSAAAWCLCDFSLAQRSLA